MNFDISSYAALRNAFYVSEVRETAGTQPSANNAWVTLLNISGVGMAYMIRLAFNISATSPQFRITRDGGTPMTIDGSSILPLYNSTRGMLPLSGIPFDSSLLIEYRQSSATSYNGEANVIWGVR